MLLLFCLLLLLLFFEVDTPHFTCISCSQDVLMTSLLRLPRQHRAFPLRACPVDISFLFELCHTLAVHTAEGVERSGSTTEDHNENRAPLLSAAYSLTGYLPFYNHIKNTTSVRSRSQMSVNKHSSTFRGCTVRYIKRL